MLRLHGTRGKGSGKWLAWENLYSFLSESSGQNFFLKRAFQRNKVCPKTFDEVMLNDRVKHYGKRKSLYLCKCMHSSWYILLKYATSVENSLNHKYATHATSHGTRGGMWKHLWLLKLMTEKKIPLISIKKKNLGETT